MPRALFEATWGPYLRHAGAARLPAAAAAAGARPRHRLGAWRRAAAHRPARPAAVRRPAGPAAPAWKPDGDDTFTTWLGGYLPRVRQLWLSGRSGCTGGRGGVLPRAGVQRTTESARRTPSSARPLWTSLGLGDGGTDPAVQERRLVAELGLGEVLPDGGLAAVRQGPGRPLDADVGRLRPRLPARRAEAEGGDQRARPAAAQRRAADEHQPRRRVPRTDPGPRPGRLAAGHPARRCELPGLGRARGQRDPGDHRRTDDHALREARRAHPGRRRRGAQRRGASGRDHSTCNRVADLIEYNHVRRVPHVPRRPRRPRGDPERARARGWQARCSTAPPTGTTRGSPRWPRKRLAQLRAARPTGLQLGAWGVVQGVRRRDSSCGDRTRRPAGGHGAGRREQGVRARPVAPAGRCRGRAACRLAGPRRCGR